MVPAVLTYLSDSKDLDGKYITTNAGDVGVSSSSDPNSAVQVTTNKNEGSNNISLHTYPVGIVDHALGLIGDDGYLDFKDLTQPSGNAKSSDHDTYSWDEFILADDDELVYGKRDATPGWIASPQGEEEWTVKYFDNTGLSTKLLFDHTAVLTLKCRWIFRHPGLRPYQDSSGGCGTVGAQSQISWT